MLTWGNSLFVKSIKSKTQLIAMLFTTMRAEKESINSGPPNPYCVCPLCSTKAENREDVLGTQPALYLTNPTWFQTNQTTFQWITVRATLLYQVPPHMLSLTHHLLFFWIFLNTPLQMRMHSGSTCLHITLCFHFTIYLYLIRGCVFFLFFALI